MGVDLASEGLGDKCMKELENRGQESSNTHRKLMLWEKTIEELSTKKKSGNEDEKK